jgi:mannosyltransferase OCH1-like enzyme
MDQIPQIIHQTWKTTTVPEPFRAVMETWPQLNKEWDFRLWTDDMNRDLIARHFPHFLEIYDNYPLPIQRADAARYFILKVYGGVYVDIDFECIKPISELLENKECAIGLEPPEHCKRFNKDRILCNAFMAAVPGHPFIDHVCQELISAVPVDHLRSKLYDVLETTGPFMLTEAFSRYSGHKGVSLIPSKYLYPATFEEARGLINGRCDDLLKGKIEEAYAFHYFWGSWLQFDQPISNTIENARNHSPDFEN